MKKLFLVFAILFCCGFCFAESNKECEQVVETFINKGEYIRVEKSNGYTYILKSLIIKIEVDGTTIQYGYNIGAKWDAHNLSTTKYEFHNDENGNLIADLKK